MEIENQEEKRGKITLRDTLEDFAAKYWYDNEYFL